jgi:hypothetical protein
VACGNDACHYIEGAPSDIDERPEFDGKRQREGLFGVGDQEVMGRMRFHLNDFSIHVDMDPILHSFFKGWELGVGPIYC